MNVWNTYNVVSHTVGLSGSRLPFIEKYIPLPSVLPHPKTLQIVPAVGFWKLENADVFGKMPGVVACGKHAGLTLSVTATARGKRISATS